MVNLINKSKYYLHRNIKLFVFAKDETNEWNAGREIQAEAELYCSDILRRYLLQRFFLKKDILKKTSYQSIIKIWCSCYSLSFPTSISSLLFIYLSGLSSRNFSSHHIASLSFLSTVIQCFGIIIL